jgi:hypothetical protein
MKTLATEIQIGQTIKSPYTNTFLSVDQISETLKKITFYGLLESGSRWAYTYKKTTLVKVK